MRIVTSHIKLSLSAVNCIWVLFFHVEFATSENTQRVEWIQTCAPRENSPQHCGRASSSSTPSPVYFDRIRTQNVRAHSRIISRACVCRSENARPRNAHAGYKCKRRARTRPRTSAQIWWAKARTFVRTHSTAHAHALTLERARHIYNKQHFANVYACDGAHTPAHARHARTYEYIRTCAARARLLDVADVYARFMFQCARLNFVCVSVC